MNRARRPLLLNPGAPPDAFPPDAAALDEPNGLIAVGGDLSPARLVAAYRRGIFPWYESGQPLLWWTPDPRLVLDPRRLRVTRSLRRAVASAGFTITRDADFAAVVDACAEPRKGVAGTWITPEMRRAYESLHALGHAHSLEVWRAGRLAGGLYGVAAGAAFFGESMFSRERDASKVALVHLCAAYAPIAGSLVDCQVPSAHLLRLGAELVSRASFVALLTHALAARGPEWPRDGAG